jgi:hypothetical protein
MNQSLDRQIRRLAAIGVVWAGLDLPPHLSPVFRVEPAWSEIEVFEWSKTWFVRRG